MNFATTTNLDHSNFSFDFFTPTHITFGKGAINKLCQIDMPGTRALIVISNGSSVTKYGYLNTVTNQLRQKNISWVVYNNVSENPTKTMVMQGARLAIDENCDFIIALGGGSVLDCATAISAMATNLGDLWDYVVGGEGLANAISIPGLPLITIPTTSGTGSEINCWAVITNEDTLEKIDFGDPLLHPIYSFIDPELMQSVPPLYTAFQGFDALFHHIEVVISNESNILSESIALMAIEHIATFLPLAVANGNDYQAREHVALGSTLAGITMEMTELTAAHAIEHALSAYYPQLPHGAGLIMISEAFYDFFIEKQACDDKFIKIAQAMGNKQAKSAKDFITALKDLMLLCNVNNLKMSDYGIAQDECPHLAYASKTMGGGLFLSNPCDMTIEDVTVILECSYR